MSSFQGWIYDIRIYTRRIFNFDGYTHWIWLSLSFAGKYGVRNIIINKSSCFIETQKKPTCEKGMGINSIGYVS